MKSDHIESSQGEIEQDYIVDLPQSLMKQLPRKQFWNKERRIRAIMISQFICMIVMWLLTFNYIILNWFAAHIVYNEYCPTAGYCTRSVTYRTYWWSYVFLILPLIFQYIRRQYPRVRCQFYILEWGSLLLVVGVLTTWERLDQYYLQNDNYSVLFSLVFSIVIVFNRHKELLLITLFWALTLTKLYRSISIGLFGHMFLTRISILSI